MSLVKDLTEGAKKLLDKKDEKNAADIGAASQESVSEVKKEDEEDEVVDVLVKDKKAKLKENISIRFQSDSIDMKKRIWYNPNVEFIIKKGTEIKLIKETNAGMLIDIPMVEFGAIRVSVPLDILTKQKAKSKL